MSEDTAIQKRPIEIIKKELMSDGAIAMFKDSLPSATGRHAEDAARRFAKMIYIAVSQSSQLQQCTPKSIIRSASISASLDLDIDPRGLAYLIPYSNNKVQPPRMEAQFQIGYLGLIELAYRSGKVKSISAHCIYESERETTKITRIDGRFSVNHPFSYKAPTGSLIAVYATAEVDGLGPQTLVLRVDEVERFRTKSKAPNSPAWSNFYDAMAKKTAIRQLAKFLPKSIAEEFSRAAGIDEKESFDEAQTDATKMIEAESGSETIDTIFEETGKPDAETQAKIDKQKADLAAEPKKKPGRPPKAKDKDAKPKYHCNKCGKDSDVLNAEDPVKGWQCKLCFSWRVISNHPEKNPDFMEEETGIDPDVD